ncbi:MAG: hypothetical protein ACRBBR_01200 [Cellvibrionaceae bacterium]
MAESSSAEAILFFDDHQVVKEMTYAEFQAILDSYVPLHDIANRHMKAVYVRINAHLHVTGAVFFNINFDRAGFVEKSWNIPLQNLADNAAKGPNMGSGPIALACYSQCPIDWQRNNLWDPMMQASLNDIVLIKKMIKNNSLGLVFEKKVEESDDDRFNHERIRAALLIKEQRLKQKLLSTKADQDMRQLSLDHQERVLAYQQELNSYQQQLNEQRSLNLELKETIAGQNDKISGMRDYFESKIQSAQEKGSDKSSEEFISLKEHYESEVLLQVEAVKAEFQSELESRNVELMYRGEREAKLKQEILTLQQENKKLLDISSDVILEKLNNAGVNFVIYHPGAGHLTIKAVDVPAYLENPTAYVAHQCGVNEHLYRIWLDHFYTPTCQKELDNGELCDKPLTRIDDPSQFIIGESDCCIDHRTNTPSIVNINKHGRLNYSSNT